MCPHGNQSTSVQFLSIPDPIFEQGACIFSRPWFLPSAGRRLRGTLCRNATGEDDPCLLHRAPLLLLPLALAVADAARKSSSRRSPAAERHGSASIGPLRAAMKSKVYAATMLAQEIAVICGRPLLAAAWPEGTSRRRRRTRNALGGCEGCSIVLYRRRRRRRRASAAAQIASSRERRRTP